MRGVERRQLDHTEGIVRRSIPRILGMLLAVRVSFEQYRIYRDLRLELDTV